MEVRFQEDRIRGWQDWEACENARQVLLIVVIVLQRNNELYIEIILYLCYFTVMLNFSSNVVECPTIQSGKVGSIIAYKLSPSLAACQPATVQEVKQILLQKEYIQR